jgi:hypothetical protein
MIKLFRYILTQLKSDLDSELPKLDYSCIHNIAIHIFDKSETVKIKTKTKMEYLFLNYSCIRNCELFFIS